MTALFAAAPTPTPSPGSTTGDSVSALPHWLLVSLLIVVVAVILAMFGLTFYNLSAPRSTLKNLLGVTFFSRGKTDDKRADPAARLAKLTAPGAAQPVSQKLIDALSTSTRVNKRTTRTTLAISGFAVLGLVVVALFGLSGSGVRDLRSEVVAAVTTLVAAISGFYFGAQTSTAGGGSPGAGTPGEGAPAGPQLGPDLDPENARFTVGTAGTYTPNVIADPPAKVTITYGDLPPSVQLDAATGVISGTPDAGTAGSYPVTLTASNGVAPDAKLSITLTVQ